MLNNPENGPIRLCAHLLGKDLETDDAEFYSVLRGPKLSHDLCCHGCAELAKVRQVEWFAADAEYVAEIEVQDWAQLGWIGTPLIEERLEAFDASLQIVEFPDAMAKCRAVYPLDEKRVLAFDGQTVGIFEGDTWTPLSAASWREEEQVWGRPPLTPRICVSPSRRFAALFNDFGCLGQVLDLEASRVTMLLDRGKYQHKPWSGHFPVAWFQHDERDLLVHAVEWNRLEISDPQTGQILTPRDPMIPQGTPLRPQSRPEHYIGYCHGALFVSPDGKRVADNGFDFVHGAVVTWNLKDWIENNAYESEDGASRQVFTHRPYFGGGPTSWIGNNRLAVAGIGYDGDIMLDGARIFDVSQGSELEPFAGPEIQGSFWSDGQRLFSVAADGLQIWNLEGVRVGKIAGFAPNFQIEGALVQIEANRMKIWRFDR